MKSKLLLILLLLGSLVSAQKSSLKNFLDYSFPSQLSTSATEAAICWADNKEGARNLFYAMGPDYRPMQLTDYSEDDGQSILQPVFTKNHDAIIYVRGSAANRQGEIPNPTSNPDWPDQAIYITNLKTHGSQKLDEGHSPLPYNDKLLFLKSGKVWLIDSTGENAQQLFEARGQISSLSLSPDKSTLAFVSQRGDHSFVGVYDMESGELKFLDPGIDRDSNPVWSPDGKMLAFLRIPYEENLIFIPRREGLPFRIMKADPKSGKAAEIFRADPGSGSVYRNISARNQLFWTTDDKIVFPWEKEGWTHLYSIPASGGKAELLTPGKLEVQYAAQSPDRKTLIFNSNQVDPHRQHIWAYDGKLRQLSSGASVEWNPQIDGAGQAFCLGSTATNPANVKRIGNDDLIAVTEEPEFPADNLVVPIPIELIAEDGLKTYGQLFMPSNIKAGEKLPGLLYFHGGSRRQMMLGFHHREYYHYAYAMNQFLAASGYVVLSLNYRSGIGYGMEFREALNYGAAGASEYGDVLAAARYLKGITEVDADRIGLFGGSYGGYLTALGLAKNSDIFKAGVDIHGVYDWNAILKNFIPSYNKLARPDFAKLAYDSSPAAVMEGWKSPVLLIHGDDDRNVPFNETVRKAQKLRELGVEFEQLVFPDEVHGFLLHENWYRAYRATKDFFDRKL
ncbi:MAG: prolyl oligopeptidase family serine peptidase [Flavobacteriaceae bacterium]